MASVKHKFVSTIPDDALSIVAGEVVPTNWNDEHSVSLDAADIAAFGGLTSASFATAIAPYITSASVAALDFVSSTSLATALGGYLTSNSASAALATDALTVRGSSTFSGTAVFLTDVRIGADLFVSSTASVGFLNVLNDAVIAGDLGVSGTASIGVVNAGSLSVSAAAVISGQLTVAGSATFSGTVVFSTAAAISGTLSVGTIVVSATAQFNGSASFSGTADFNSSITVSATASVGHLNVAGTTALTGQLTVAGTATFSGTAIFSTALAVSGTASIGTLVVSGTATFSGTAVFVTTAQFLGTVTFSALPLLAGGGSFLTSASASALYITSNSVSTMITTRISTLDNIGDVSLSHSVADGQVLKWNNTANQWVNANDDTGAGSSATLTIDTLTVLGTATFSGASAFLTTMSVSGAAHFVSQATFDATTTFSGTAVFLTSARISGTLSTGGIVVTAGATFNGSATFSGTAVFLTEIKIGTNRFDISYSGSVADGQTLVWKEADGQWINATPTGGSVSATLTLDTLTVLGTATFSGAAAFLTTISVSGAANIVGGLTVGATASFSARAYFGTTATAGRIVIWTGGTANDYIQIGGTANQDIDWNSNFGGNTIKIRGDSTGSGGPGEVNLSNATLTVNGTATFSSMAVFKGTIGVSATASVGALLIGGHAFNLSLSQSVADGQVLTYNNTDNKWRNATPSGGTPSNTLSISILQVGDQLTVLGSATFSGSAVFNTAVQIGGDPGFNFFGATNLVKISSGGAVRFAFNLGDNFFGAAGNIAFAASDPHLLASIDTALARNAAGVLEINNGSGGTFRDLIIRNLRADGSATFSGPVQVGSLLIGGHAFNLSLSGSVADGQFLQYNNTDNKWRNVTVTPGGTSASLDVASINVTGSASFGGPVTLNTKPMGSVLLGSASIASQNSVRFSGSWSDYAILELFVFYQSTATHAAIVDIYTDGGTTTLFTTTGVSLSGAAKRYVEAVIHNGTAFKSVAVEHKAALTRAGNHSASANTGFLNAIQLQANASLTMSSGTAQLYGRRR